MTPKVSLEELSRWIDGEVTPEERMDIERRLRACPASAAILQRLQDVTGRVATAILSAPPSPLPLEGPNCLDESLLSHLADGSLSPSERERIETHLAECRSCFRLVFETLRAEARLRKGEWPDLPSDVVASPPIQALLHRPPPPPQEIWGELSLHLASESASSRLFSEGPCTVLVVMRSVERGKVRIECTLDEEGMRVVGRSIVVSDDATHRKLFSGKTDRQGLVRIPPLSPGRYTLHIEETRLKIALWIER